MLSVPRHLVDEVVAVIRTCGGSARECVCYVTATTGRRTLATGLIHPDHLATPSSTEVDEEELERIWDLLLEHGETIVLQIHSHPGPAYHSPTDDCWPAIHRPGFVSLVLPSFGARGLEGAHVTTYKRGGGWAPSHWDIDDDRLLITGGTSL